MLEGFHTVDFGVFTFVLSIIAISVDSLHGKETPNANPTPLNPSKESAAIPIMLQLIPGTTLGTLQGYLTYKKRHPPRTLP